MTLGYTKAMIRYASERYAEVELILGAKKGLKIPNSSIVEKDFFAIPKNIFYENPADGKLGFSAQ